MIQRVQQQHSGTAKLSFTVLLTLLLLAFALQPCFAIPMQVNAGCCGHGHKNGCHVPAPDQICAMQATVFAGPENPARALVTIAMPVPVEHRASTVLSPVAEIVPPRDGSVHTDLYLRNLILLI